ncbi:MAG: hypothetical protein Q9220_005498 [cf. Caloplaca sp. 1 TL-2023]
MLSRSMLFAIAAFSGFVHAQVTTSCDPTKGTCPNDKGLTTSTYSVDFTTLDTVPSEWTIAAYENVTCGPQGAEFAFSKRYDAPTMWTNFKFFFGRVEMVVKAAPGTGIVSSMVLLSDDLDEVDWEFLGGVTSTVQTNYFGKGYTGSYNRSTTPAVTSPQTTFHTYALDWSPTALIWSIDGVAVRTLNAADADGNGSQYPQSPMKVSLGLWDAGDPDAATQGWGGGVTPIPPPEPYIMYVKSVKIWNTNPGAEYQYMDRSGTWQSIKVIKNASISSSSSQTSTQSTKTLSLGSTTSSSSSTLTAAPTTSSSTSSALVDASSSKPASITNSSSLNGSSTASTTASNPTSQSAVLQGTSTVPSTAGVSSGASSSSSSFQGSSSTNTGDSAAASSNTLSSAAASKFQSTIRTTATSTVTHCPICSAPQSSSSVSPIAAASSSHGDLVSSIPYQTDTTNNNSTAAISNDSSSDTATILVTVTVSPYPLSASSIILSSVLPGSLTPMLSSSASLSVSNSTLLAASTIPVAGFTPLSSQIPSSSSALSISSLSISSIASAGFSSYSSNSASISQYSSSSIASTGILPVPSSSAPITSATVVSSSITPTGNPSIGDSSPYPSTTSLSGMANTDSVPGVSDQNPTLLNTEGIAVVSSQADFTSSLSQPTAFSGTSASAASYYSLATPSQVTPSPAIADSNDDSQPTDAANTPTNVPANAATVLSGTPDNAAQINTSIYLDSGFNGQGTSTAAAIATTIPGTDTSEQSDTNAGAVQKSGSSATGTIEDDDDSSPTTTADGSAGNSNDENAQSSGTAAGDNSTGGSGDGEDDDTDTSATTSGANAAALSDDANNTTTASLDNADNNSDDDNTPVPPYGPGNATAGTGGSAPSAPSAKGAGNGTIPFHGSGARLELRGWRSWLFGLAAGAVLMVF